MVPAVEVTDDRHIDGIRRPDTENGIFLTACTDGMRTEKALCVIIPALIKEVQREIVLILLICHIHAFTPVRHFPACRTILSFSILPQFCIILKRTESTPYIHFTIILKNYQAFLVQSLKIQYIA